MRNSKCEVADSALRNQVEQPHHLPPQPLNVFAAVACSLNENAASSSSATDTPPDNSKRCVAGDSGGDDPKKKMPIVATVRPFSVSRPAMIDVENRSGRSSGSLVAGNKSTESTPHRVTHVGGERPAYGLASASRWPHSTSVNLDGTVAPPGTASPAAAVTPVVRAHRGNVAVPDTTSRGTAESRRTHLVGGHSSSSSHRGSKTLTDSSTARSSKSPADSSRTEPIPDGYARVARCLQLPSSSELDEERLVANCSFLERSTFYCRSATSSEAKEMLRYSHVGTFLVRDSSHPRYLYSLSVKTRRGITSIRLAYDASGFWLDSEPDQAGLMPVFETVVDLVSHYAAEGRRSAADAESDRGQSKSSCVFLERSGRRDLPVFLRYPYRGGNTTQPATSSLKHLCRLTINGALAGRCPGRLVINPSLREYLKQYPFDV